MSDGVEVHGECLVIDHEAIEARLAACEARYRAIGATQPAWFATDLAALLAENRRLREALEVTAYDGDGECVICMGKKPGHYNDCEIRPLTAPRGALRWPLRR